MAFKEELGALLVKMSDERDELRKEIDALETQVKDLKERNKSRRTSGGVGRPTGSLDDSSSTIKTTDQSLGLDTSNMDGVSALNTSSANGNNTSVDNSRRSRRSSFGGNLAGIWAEKAALESELQQLQTLLEGAKNEYEEAKKQSLASECKATAAAEGEASAKAEVASLQAALDEVRPGATRLSLPLAWILLLFVYTDSFS